MPDKTRKTTSTAGTDTRALTSTELHRGALDAIGGYPELTAALARLNERIKVLRTPGPPPPDPVDVGGRLLAGEDLPEAGEIGQAILDAEHRTAVCGREVQVLDTVRDEQRGMREMALRAGSGAAFAWLGTQLDTLLDRGRAILSQLGTVRTFEQALDSEHPTEARDQLRALRALATEYAVLREAQGLLVGTVADVQRQNQSYAWADQVALVAKHGLIANPQVVGQPPADPYDQLVWLLSRSPAPQACVPDYRELQRRADAAKPRPPQSPPTLEPNTEGPGGSIQRIQRVRAQASGAPGRN